MDGLRKNSYYKLLDEAERTGRELTSEEIRSEFEPNVASRIRKYREKADSDWEDFFQQGNIAVIKAWRGCREPRAFPALAKKVIANALFDYQKHLKTGNQHHDAESLDCVIAVSDDGVQNTLYDFIGKEDDLSEKDFWDAARLLNDSQFQAVNLRVIGHTQTEIADEMGISQQAVDKKLKKSINILEDGCNSPSYPVLDSRREGIYKKLTTEDLDQGRQEMLDRHGETAQEIMGIIGEELESCRKRGESNPTYEELAKRTGLTVGELAWAEFILNNNLMLKGPVQRSAEENARAEVAFHRLANLKRDSLWLTESYPRLLEIRNTIGTMAAYGWNVRRETGRVDEQLGHSPGGDFACSAVLKKLDEKVAITRSDLDAEIWKLTLADATGMGERLPMSVETKKIERLHDATKELSFTVGLMINSVDNKKAKAMKRVLTRVLNVDGKSEVLSERMAYQEHVELAEERLVNIIKAAERFLAKRESQVKREGASQAS